AERHRKGEIRFGVEFPGFGLEALQDLAAVQLEVIGIGAQEADGVGRAGKQLRTSGLERREIIGFYLERGRDVVEAKAERLTLLPQHTAGRSPNGWRRRLVAG